MVRETLATKIKQAAREVGFSACGLVAAEEITGEGERLDRWLADDCCAGMEYLRNHREMRLDPRQLVPGARTIISVALNYYPAERREEDEPYIAYYAYGKDYHVVMKKKLRELWEKILPLHEGEEMPAMRAFTDSAPVLERYWAWRAGIGWIGRNTCLIIPGKGSYFFLGEIITTWEISADDKPQQSRCGTCTRCVEACPTGALSQHRIDARRCLSYLTIEHRGELPEREGKLLGGRIFGCDTCQKACPWNRFASPTEERAFQASPALLSLKKEQLAGLTVEEYNRIFAQSAVKRAKYDGLMRNIRANEDFYKH